MVERFFFYGSLRDPHVRTAVFPHLDGRLQIEAAHLPGYRLAYSTAYRCPVLTPQAGRRVTGDLVVGLDRRALARMAHYEADIYHPEELEVRLPAGERCRAWVFLAAYAGTVGQRPWRFERWRRLEKRKLLSQVPRWMTDYGAANLRSLDIPWRTRRTLLTIAKNLPNDSNPASRG